MKKLILYSLMVFILFGCKKYYDIIPSDELKIAIVAGGNSAGSSAEQLNYPEDVYVDIDGSMYIADRLNNRIQKWVPGATSGITVAGGNTRLSRQSVRRSVWSIC